MRRASRAAARASDEPGWRRVSTGERRRRRSLVGVAIAALSSLAPSRARACRPAPNGVERLSRPSWSEGAALELVDERVELDCERSKRHLLTCHWRASYTYAGPGGSSIDGIIELRADIDTLTAVRVSLDGEVVEARQLAASGLAEHVELHVEDSASVEVGVEVDFEVDTDKRGYCYEPAGVARHPIVTTYPHETTVAVHDGLVQDVDARAQVHVRAPPGYRVDLDFHAPDSRTRTLDATLDSRRLYRVRLRNRAFIHGPVAGFGIGFGPEVRARLRLGYELAAPAFTLFSAAVEGDAVEELMVVPAVEVASPVMLVAIPSLGVGLGAPVMVLPQARAGVRVLGSVKWWFAGLVGSVDVYPRVGDSRQTLRGALMIELSI